MAWYYNSILSQNFEIGVVAISRRRTGPSASWRGNLRLSPGIRKFQNFALAKIIKNDIFEWPALSLKFGLFFGRKKDSLACSSTRLLSPDFRRLVIPPRLR